MKRRSALPMLALVAVLLVGCRDSEDELVRRTVHEFHAALVREDGATACDLLAEAGSSELLLTAVRAQIQATGLEGAAVDRCAVIVRRLAENAPELSTLRPEQVTRTLLEGDVATVETEEGSYELEEVKGRWLLTRFEPVASVLAGESPAPHPVSLTIARPKLSEPALGRAVAGRTRKETVELTGTFEPDDARVRVQPSPGTGVKVLEASDGRLRAELELRRGRNEILLTASAPGRAETELAVRLTRE